MCMKWDIDVNLSNVDKLMIIQKALIDALETKKELDKQINQIICKSNQDQDMMKNFLEPRICTKLDLLRFVDENFDGILSFYKIKYLIALELLRE